MAWWQCYSCGMDPRLIFPVALQGVVVSVVGGVKEALKWSCLGSLVSHMTPAEERNDMGMANCLDSLAFS